MAETLTSNLIIPEVLEAKINTKLTDNMVFLPVAEVDNTLAGQPGDTIKFTSYAYIGDADETAENGLITPVALSQSYVSATVKKATKGVTITDEAMTSAYGDPMDEAASQIAKSIDNKVDNDLLTSLEGVSVSRQLGTAADMTADLVADALAIFGEDGDGTKAFYVTSNDVASLRKDGDYIRSSELGQDMVLRGNMGGIWGCTIIPANKIKADTTDGELRRYIVKPGAVKIINKRSTMVEPKREADYGRTSIFANKHYTTYLYDESKVVMIRQFTALKTLADTDIVSTAGAETDGTLLDIKVGAPVGYKWVYKLGTEDVTNAAFGTALSGYTDWTSKTTEIAASTNTKAHVALVNATDNKPVKQLNVTLVKKL